MPQRWRSLADPLFDRTVLPLLRWQRRKNFRIMMYHRFRGTAEEIRSYLTFQCEHLRRHYTPVSMTEIAETVSGAESNRRQLPENAVAVTVDDGYRDFLPALRVFREFDIPVTLYVVTGFIDGRIWLWPDEVVRLVRSSPLQQAEVRLSSGEIHKFRLHDDGARQASIGWLHVYLVACTDHERRRILAALPDALQTALPAEIPENCQPLTWQELHQMCAQGLDVGAHTVTHPILARVERDANVQTEVDGSRRRIQEMLGENHGLHFCYPNGRPDDFGAREMAAVAKAGFATAVTTVGALNHLKADPFQLARIGVEPEFSEMYFARKAAGVRLEP